MPDNLQDARCRTCGATLVQKSFHGQLAGPMWCPSAPHGHQTTGAAGPYDLATVERFSFSGKVRSQRIATRKQ
jgi:hypothetical protein